MPLSLRKVGGLYWLRLGRLRLAFCIVAKPRPVDPIRLAFDRDRRAYNRAKAAQIARDHLAQHHSS